MGVGPFQLSQHDRDAPVPMVVSDSPQREVVLLLLSSELEAVDLDRGGTLRVALRERLQLGSPALLRNLPVHRA